MAQKATIYKVDLSVSDMDRHYYETHKLTVAKHPSETDERLMVRLIAFALMLVNSWNSPEACRQMMNQTFGKRASAVRLSYG